MNNPFDLNQNRDTHTENESRRLKIRTGILMGLFLCVILIFVGELVQIQLVDGADYLNSANYTTAQTETVDSVRGEILDRYGRVLVSNTASYAVTLDTSLMDPDRNAILTELLSLCREEGVEWSDSLPISRTAPWQYTRTEDLFSYETTEDDGSVTVSYTTLGKLAKSCKWVEDPADADLSAEELLRAMCATFGIELAGNDPITPEIRDLAGVLYMVSLRTYGIVVTDYTFASGVDITFISKVKEHGLTGVIIQSTASRQYNTSYAAHVLGRVGKYTSDQMWLKYKELGYPYNAVVGLEGVELAFESYLHGTSGVRQIETDAKGKIRTQSWKTEPVPGNNVVLTLDLTLQSSLEDQLAEYMSALENPRGAAVVVDMTGGVLAMASYPTYDLSTYSMNFTQLSQDPAKPLTNRATQGLYAPGSTFKMVTAVAALTEGAISPTSTVNCTGFYTYFGVTQGCWYRYGHGSENVTKAITDSCNVFFYDTGINLGISKLVEYAAKFGLGQYTGIEITEEKGYVAGPETSAILNQEWYGGDVTSAAIGQGNNQFTPLQLANYVATLVNGGNHYQAHLLKEVKSSDYSQTVYEYEPVLVDTIDIAPAHLAAVKLGMYNLSKTASMARYFSDLPVEIGCKTGTAEVAQSDANAVFVCFAPYDDPQIAICLVAEQGASGGNLASLAAGILAQYFSTESSLNDLAGENTLLR